MAEEPNSVSAYEEKRKKAEEFCKWRNYNLVERRESLKGGKEANKKGAALQSSTKPNPTYSRRSSSHGNRRNFVPVSSSSHQQPPKSSKPTDLVHVSAYEEQITELKLSVDSLEKQRDFYFSKMRDVEILCQYPEIENSPIAEALKRILYATDDDASVMVEAQDIISTPPVESGPPPVPN